MFNLIWNSFSHFNLVLVANFRKVWNQNKMLHWNLDWNSSQDREDAIHKQIITKLFVKKLKTVFFVLKIVQNSSRNIWSYQSSSSVSLETLSLSELSLELSDESSLISKVLRFFKVDFRLLYALCFCCLSLCSLALYQ